MADADACAVCDGTGLLLRDVCPLCDGNPAHQVEELAAAVPEKPQRSRNSLAANADCFATDGFRGMLKEMFSDSREAFAKALSSDCTQLSREDLHRFVRTQMGDDNTAHANRLFDRIDTDGDGSVSQEEFVVFFEGEIAKPKPDFALLGFKERMRVTFQTYQEAFNALEVDDDGLISRKELGRYIDALGEHNVSYADRIFDKIDENRDNYITAGEFKRFFQKGFARKPRDSGDDEAAADNPGPTMGSMLEIDVSAASGTLHGSAEGVVVDLTECIS